MGHLPGTLNEGPHTGASIEWEQVPPPRPFEPAWTSALAFGALCAGPVLAIGRSGLSPGWTGAVVIAVAIGAVCARSGLRALAVVPVGVTGVTAAVLGRGPTGGGPRTAVAVLVLVLVAWELGGRAARGTAAGRRRRLRPAIIVAAATGSACILAGLDGVAVIAGVVAAALALLSILPVSERVLALLDRPIERISQVVGALATVPALVLITLRWATDRVTGNDPLAAPHRRGWVSSTGAVDPVRLHGADRVAGRWRSRLSALLVLAILALPIAYVVLRPDPTPTPPAVAGEPTWPRLFAETSDLTRRLRLDPTTIFRLPDYQGEFVNQSDGRRRTWQPPPCDCPRYRVWWFGASAAWGMYQRDDETIASEVAKAAWRQGVALEIENRATPGFVVDQEVRAIEAALESGDPPDLIVVLDGANDATLQVDRNAVGRGADRSGGPDIEQSLGGLSRLSDLWAGLKRSDLAGAVQPDTEHSTPPLDPDELAEHTAARMRANITSARALAAAFGTRVAFLWQPTLASTPSGTGVDGVPDLGQWGEVMRTAPNLLSGYTTDLSGALSGSDTPVLVDEVHFSEHGAERLGEVVATELIEQLRTAPRP
jgi:lysophospholipase L1-like esterase